MISADVKPNINNKKQKIWWKYLQNLKYNAKSVCIFHLFLVGIPSILIMSVKNRKGWGFFA